MNLINFANLEMSSPSPEGLDIHGQAGTALKGRNLSGEEKVFETTFKEHLGKDKLGLTRKDQDHPGGKGGNSEKSGNSVSQEEKPRVQQSNSSMVRIKERAAKESPDAEVSDVTGKTLTLVPESLEPSGVQVADEPSANPAVEGNVVSASQETVESQNPVQTTPFPSEEPESGARWKHSDNPGNPAGLNRGEPVGRGGILPLEGSIPEGERPIEGDNRGKDIVRPVEWTREHVNGKKLLPERIERPTVPSHAQARFVRAETAVEPQSAGLNQSQATREGLPTVISQSQGQQVSVEVTSTERPVSMEQAAPAGENPKVTAYTKEQVFEEAKVPERPAVPPQSQASFVREGERPQRPTVPPQSQASFVREGERPQPVEIPSKSQGQASRPVVLNSDTSGTTGEIPDPSDNDRKEATRRPGQRIRSTIQDWREQIDRGTRPGNRPVASAPVQGQFIQEESVSAEKLLEIRTKSPDERLPRQRINLVKPQPQVQTVQTQGIPNTSNQSEAAQLPPPAATVVPESTDKPVPSRRRETPRARYERLSSLKTNGSETNMRPDEGTILKDAPEAVRRTDSFLSGEDSVTEKKVRSRNKDNLENQENRMEKANSVSTKSGSAISRAQLSSQVASVNEAYMKIIATVERMTETAVSNRVHLKINLDNGDEMKVLLKVAKGHLHTIFMTDSDSLRTAMKDGWEQFQRQMSEKGLASSLPEFRGNNQDRENRRSAEQSWNDLLDEAGFVKSTPSKPVESSSEAGTVRRTDLASSHSLDTYA